MDTPSVHMHGFELRSNSSVKHSLLHVRRNAIAIIQKNERAFISLFSRSNKNLVRVCVSRIAKHFNAYILHAADIMLCLPSLCLGNTQPNKPFAEVFLDAKGSLACYRSDKTKEV